MKTLDENILMVLFVLLLKRVHLKCVIIQIKAKSGRVRVNFVFWTKIHGRESTK